MDALIRDLLEGSPTIVVVVIAFVEWLKAVGVSGRWLPLASMASGILFGGLYLYVTNGTFGLESVLYGVVLGLVASGVFRAVKSATQHTTD